METLKVQPVSKAQSRQRCGRAGRECPGVCYRLYPETVFHAMNEETVPEIMRCNLKSKFCNLIISVRKNFVIISQHVYIKYDISLESKQALRNSCTLRNVIAKLNPVNLLMKKILFGSI